MIGDRQHLTPGTKDVLAERRRQIDGKGFNAAHDDGNPGGLLAEGACCYALTAAAQVRHGRREPLNPEVPSIWPYAPDAWDPKDARRNLVKAAAMMLAEIDRIDRQGDGT